MPLGHWRRGLALVACSACQKDSGVRRGLGTVSTQAVPVGFSKSGAGYSEARNAYVYVACEWEQVSGSFATYFGAFLTRTLE